MKELPPCAVFCQPPAPGDLPARVSAIASSSFWPRFAASWQGSRDRTIALIGGSSSVGATLRAHESSYAELLVAGLTQQLDSSSGDNVTARLVNLAQGSTRTAWATMLWEALWAESQPPDLIVWEYSINDIYMCSERPEDEAEQLSGALKWQEVLSCTLEVLLRRIAKLRPAPAVLLVFLWACGLKPYQKRESFFSIATPLVEHYAHTHAMPILAVDAATELHLHFGRRCLLTPTPSIKTTTPCAATPEFARATRSKDGCHPNARTHGLLAQLLLRAVDDAHAVYDAHAPGYRPSEIPAEMPPPLCRALRAVYDPRHEAVPHLLSLAAHGCPPDSHGLGQPLDPSSRLSCNATISVALRLRDRFDAAAFTSWRPSTSFDAIQRTLESRPTSSPPRLPSSSSLLLTGEAATTTTAAEVTALDRGMSARLRRSRSIARRPAASPAAFNATAASQAHGHGRAQVLLPPASAIRQNGLHVSRRHKCLKDARRRDCKFALGLPCCGPACSHADPSRCTTLQFHWQAPRTTSARRPPDVAGSSPGGSAPSLRTFGALWKVGVASAAAVRDVVVIAEEAVISPEQAAAGGGSSGGAARQQGSGWWQMGSWLGQRAGQWANQNRPRARQHQPQPRLRVLSAEAVVMHLSRCTRTLDPFVQGIGHDAWWLPVSPASFTSLGFCTLDNSSSARHCEQYSHSNATSSGPGGAYLHYFALFYG